MSSNIYLIVFKTLLPPQDRHTCCPWCSSLSMPYLLRSVPLFLGHQAVQVPVLTETLYPSQTYNFVLHLTCHLKHHWWTEVHWAKYCLIACRTRNSPLYTICWLPKSSLFFLHGFPSAISLTCRLKSASFICSSSSLPSQSHYGLDQPGCHFKRTVLCSAAKILACTHQPNSYWCLAFSWSRTQAQAFQQYVPQTTDSLLSSYNYQAVFAQFWWLFRSFMNLSLSSAKLEPVSFHASSGTCLIAQLRCSWLLRTITCYSI